VAGFVRGCAGSDGGGGHLAASRSASRGQWVATMGLFPSSSPSGCRRRAVVVILVIGTLFSSWRALAGAGYLSRGMWSVVGVVGRWVLTCTWYPFFSLLLVAIGCCSRRRVHRTCPGGKGGGSVVEGSG